MSTVQTSHQRRRKPLRRALIAAGSLLTLACVGLGAAGGYTVQRSFPQLDGVIEVAALQGEAQILRDAKGRVTIRASNAEDLFLAQGYAQAQDRFWSMEVARRTARGELAELLGRSALSSDRLARALQFSEVADASLGLLDQATISHLEAFAAGVTAYLRERPLPAVSVEYAVLGITDAAPEPRAWTAQDSLAWLGYSSWLTQRRHIDREREVGTVASELPPASLQTIRDAVAVPAQPLGTAVATSGEGARLAVALNEPGPGTGSWYPVRLQCVPVSLRCPYDLTGLTHPALPGVTQGSNGEVAWSLTPYAADSADLVLERVRVQESQFGGGWAPLEERTATIRVRGANNESFRWRSTQHGPLLSDFDPDFAVVGANARGPREDSLRGTGYGVALRRAGAGPGKSLAALFEMSRATDWTSWRRALGAWTGPPMLATFADRSGAIGQQVAGAIPIRRSGSASEPAFGWLPQAGWTGRSIGFAELPTRFDPRSGELIDAAAAPSNQTPYDLGRSFADPAREERLAELVNPALAAPELLDALADRRSLVWPRWRDALVAVDLDRGFESLGWRELRFWDGEQGPNSVAAAYFNAVVAAAMELTFGDELPSGARATADGRWLAALTSLLDQPTHPLFDDVTTAELETGPDILRAALLKGRDALIQAQDRDPSKWRWDRTLTSDVERVDPRLGSWLAGLLGEVTIRAGGSIDAVNAQGLDWSTGQLASMTTAQFGVDLATGEVWLGLLGGTSGHPFSRFDTDSDLVAGPEAHVWPTQVEQVAALTLVSNRTN